MFVSCVAVSRQIVQASRKSLVKITSLVYNSHVIEVILWTNWFACWATLKLLSPIRTAPLCSFNLVSKALSVCLSIVHEVAINVADLVNNSSVLLFGRNVFKVLMTLFLTFGSSVWFQFYKKNVQSSLTNQMSTVNSS